MPGKRVERLQIMLSEEELAAIDEWRFRQRMPSRSAAVRAMLNAAMNNRPAPDPGGPHRDEIVPPPELRNPQINSVEGPQPAHGQGRRILVIEQERVAAAGITTLLEDAGHEVVTVISGPKEWREAGLTVSVECAVIGDGLHPELAIRMADELDQEGIPFVYFSAKPQIPIPERFCKAPIINADSGADEFNEALARVCG